MKLYYLIVITSILSFTFSCFRPTYKVSNPLYEFEEAKLNTFNELERSILKLTCSAFYENYYYAPPSQSSGDSVSQESLLIEKKFSTNSVAGTGLFVIQSANKILILSCYHVFDFEDSLKTYYFDKNKKITKYLESRSIKYGQTIYVTHKNGTISQGKIITQDKRMDIALIETQAIENALSEIPFQGTFSKASKLKLGQEIYLVGFPKGYFMITRGLASPSKYKDKFLVDASFNRGFSGGVTIMFDNQTGDYQYVGMANSTAYDSQIALGPSGTIINLESYQSIPYEEDIYIKELKLINYGITFVVSGEVISDFFKMEEYKLRQFGYYNISKLVR
jgi:hypothetical protein